LLASESCVYDEKSNNPRPELLPYQIIVLMVNDVKEFIKSKRVLSPFSVFRPAAYSLDTAGLGDINWLYKLIKGWF